MEIPTIIMSSLSTSAFHQVPYTQKEQCNSHRKEVVRDAAFFNLSCTLIDIPHLLLLGVLSLSLTLQSPTQRVPHLFSLFIFTSLDPKPYTLYTYIDSVQDVA